MNTKPKQIWIREYENMECSVFVGNKHEKYPTGTPVEFYLLPWNNDDGPPIATGEIVYSCTDTLDRIEFRDLVDAGYENMFEACLCLGTIVDELSQTLLYSTVCTVIRVKLNNEKEPNKA